MTQSELITLIQREVKGLTAKLETTDYTDAVDQSERDCGWVLPQTTDFKITWLKRRAIRHLYQFLLSESANKFKVKDKFLNQKFEHYLKLVESEDKAFEKAQEDNTEEFADVSSFNLFGTKVDAGFAYQGGTGKDMTYDDDNEVISSPNEDS